MLQVAVEEQQELERELQQVGAGQTLEAPLIQSAPQPSIVTFKSQPCAPHIISRRAPEWPKRQMGPQLALHDALLCLRLAALLRATAAAP